MNDYLIQTKYAASNLIDLIRTEEFELQELITSLISSENQCQEFIEKDFSQDNLQQHLREIVLQDLVIERIERTKIEIKNMKTSISSKQESIGALSGALLQIAKQGIGMVHNSWDNCPPGRTIYNEPIKNIIRQARNQSMHFEEGEYHSSVWRCFKNIGFTLGNKNLAKEILDLLGWDTYADYEHDLISLLG